MKRKIFALVFMLALLLQPGFAAADELLDLTRAQYPEAQEAYRPKSSIIIDAKSGDILWEDNADEVRDPASLSKMMALYLVFEAMAAGKFTPETTVKATETDQAISQIYEISNNKIVAGVDYTVADLTLATIIPSSNAATLMLARLVEPDHDAFIDRMNAKAKELGMTASRFYNGTGAIASSFQGHYQPQRYDNSQANQVTVRDYATLIYAFVNDYPDILNYTGNSVVTIQKGTPYEETFTSHNYSLPGMRYAFEGMTGFKTGSSPSAGFNLIGSAKREDQELISVSLGSGDWSDQGGEAGRHPFVNALLEQAFTNYDYKLVLEAGEHTLSGKKIKVDQPVYATVSATDQTPKLTYKDGQIQVENGLTKVSDTVAKRQTIKASEVKEPANTRKTKQKSNRLLLGGSIAAAIILIILALIWLKPGFGLKRRENPTAETGRRRRRKG